MVLLSFLQEPSTCHYVLSVAVPGLCHIPTFRQETESITQIVCTALPSPAAPQSDAEISSQDTQQQQQIVQQDVGDDVGDLDSEARANSTEQVST